MSRSSRASARRPAGGSRRLTVLVLCLPLIGGLAASTALAEPPPAVQRLSSAQAAAAGSAIALVRHGVDGAAVLEVVPNSPAGVRLLAATADGARVAVTGPPVEGEGWLVIASPDGAQVRVALSGVSSAAFSPSGEALAAVDGRGVLWQVDAASGAARRVADGPYAGSPLFNADGSLIALAVSSVEAPYPSRAVRLDLVGGPPQPLSDDELVYAVWQLADGSLAMLVHEPGGNRVKRLVGTGPSLLADLGPGAIATSVSDDGSLVAFQRGGEVFTADGRGSTRRMGAGSAPQLSPDGKLLLVRRGAGSVLIDLASGEVRASYIGIAAFTECNEECLP